MTIKTYNLTVDATYPANSYANCFSFIVHHDNLSRVALKRYVEYYQNGYANVTYTVANNEPSES